MILMFVFRPLSWTSHLNIQSLVAISTWMSYGHLRLTLFQIELMIFWSSFVNYVITWLSVWKSTVVLASFPPQIKIIRLSQIDLTGFLRFPLIHYHSVQFSSVQSLTRVQLCDPMNCSTPGLPVHHHLPEFTQTHIHPVSDAIQPSHPLSSPSPPAPNPSQHQSLFQWVNSSHEVAEVLEFQL